MFCFFFFLVLLYSSDLFFSACLCLVMIIIISISHSSLLLWFSASHEYVSSHIDEAEPSQRTPPSVDVQPWTLKAPSSAAELDARLAQYEQRTEEEDDDEEERIPDIQKDDMMARRTGVFQKQASAAGTHSRFLPLPSSKCCTQTDSTDAAPRSKAAVQAKRNKELNVRWADV